MTDVPTLTSLVSRSHPGRSAAWPRSTAVARSRPRRSPGSPSLGCRGWETDATRRATTGLLRDVLGDAMDLDPVGLENQIAALTWVVPEVRTAC